MIAKEIVRKFLTNTDETGRFIVTSLRTGRKYFVEPIGKSKTDWGSINPATGNLMNKKGHDKYQGSINEKDSLITPENGFKNIIMLDVGKSPLAYIDEIDAKYPAKVSS